MKPLLLISDEEQQRRLAKVREQMELAGIDSALVASFANIYYLTGRVFSGFVYIPPKGEAPVYFVKRPVHLLSERSISMRRTEGMLSELKVRGIATPQALGLELSLMSYAKAEKLMQVFGCAQPLDVTPCLRQARATKTAAELAMVRESGIKHDHVYKKIPQLFCPGMTDVDLQIEIERLSREEGCLGQFRIAGDDMELFMGNVLAGDNADNPSPYDFAMGGAGLNPSIPVGANGTIIQRGMAVMVDVNGNFNGYMTDMTRTFYLGQIDEKARYAHEVSIEICRALAAMGVPGTEAKALYEKAEQMAAEADLTDYFMGHTQHAGFVGHGIGIEVNELPVIAPRSRDVLQAGNVIALEPKFVIPHVGAVGIENTYVVTPEGMQSLTHAPEQLISLDK